MVARLVVEILVAAVPLVRVRAGNATREQRGLQRVGLDLPRQAVVAAVRVATRARERAALRDRGLGRVEQHHALVLLVRHRRRDQHRAGRELRGARERALGIDHIDVLDVARERAPHEQVAVGADRDAIGTTAVLAGGQGRRHALGDADLRRVLDLEDRVRPHAGDVQRVVRRVPRERPRLVLRDRRGGLHGPVAIEAEERELVRDRWLEATTVAARVPAHRDLHGGLALERNDRLVITHERDRERGAREALAVGSAAAAAAAGRGRGRQRDMLGGVGLEQVDLIDRAGLEIRDQRARAVGRDREPTRLVPQGGPPALLAGSGVVRDQGTVGDVVTITVLRSGDSAIPKGSTGVAIVEPSASVESPTLTTAMRFAKRFATYASLAAGS